MVVNEGLEVAKPEETVPEPRATDAPGHTAAQAWTGPSWLRLAYAIELLLALLVVFTVWGEVGGHSHLDMMPWYIKLACAGSMACGFVRFTAGMVEEQRAWNWRSARWFVALFIVALLMGGITYYYHLQEAQDQPDNDDTTATSVKVAAPSGVFSRTSDRTIR